MVGLIVYDSGSTTHTNTPTLIFLLTKDEINFVKSLRKFEYAIEMLNVSVTSSTKEQLEQLCNKTIDNSQDFTDSIYISIEQREKVLEYHKKLQEQLAEIIQILTNSHDIELSLLIQSIQQVARDFRKQVKKIFTRNLNVYLFLSWNKWQFIVLRNFFEHMMKVFYLMN
jgi:hypothetical protein